MSRSDCTDTLHVTVVFPSRIALSYQRRKCVVRNQCRLFPLSPRSPETVCVQRRRPACKEKKRTMKKEKRR